MTSADVNPGNALSITLTAQWSLVNYTENYSYLGKTQSFSAPYTGYYKLEVWGAQGGNSVDCEHKISGVKTTVLGGKGGYSTGVVQVIKNSSLYIYVGGAGQNVKNAGGGWNGGGDTKFGNNAAGGGGGATDISTQGTANSTTWNEEKHLYSRLIVAGAGGGGGENNSYSPGAGGGNNGIRGDTGLAAGTQISGGGAFGIGQASTAQGDDAGGGGAGWYGGGSGTSASATGATGYLWPTEQDGDGSGGSGWIYTSSTYNNWSANSTEGKSGKWKLDSSYYLTSASTIAGNQTFKSPSGTNETGHSGNGYARITWIGDTL